MSDVVDFLKRETEAVLILKDLIKDIILDDQDMLDTAIEGETNFNEAIGRAEERRCICLGHADALDSRIAQLQDRKARFEQQANLLKTAIYTAVSAAGKKKVELPGATFSIKATAVQLEIVDESEIPSQYFKRGDPKLQKADLLAALKALGKDDEAIPGCRLTPPGETLQIRRG